MVKRILSAMVLAPIFLGLIYFGGYATGFLVLVITAIALYEFLRIGEKMGIKPWYGADYTALLIWIGALLLAPRAWLVPLVVCWLFASMAVLAVKYPRVTLMEACYNCLAVIYSGVLLSHFYLIRALPDGLFWVLLTIFMVWGTDTGAYFLGRAFGKHKLAPHVSPQKTVEGAFGGVLFSVLVALCFYHWNPELNLVWYGVLGLVVSICAQIGDLFESALKRLGGVKDSGSLIPGHGGILDRFDSFMFVLPIVYNIIKLSS